MKRSDFFKKSEEAVEPPKENKILFDIAERKEEDTSRVYKKKIGIIDRNIIQYIIDNFPSMSVEIRNALINLVNTLENTIDFIEDKSSNAIKSERDFELAEAYRSKAMSIYEVVQNMDEYIDWMRTEYDKNNSNDSSNGPKDELNHKESQVIEAESNNNDNDAEEEAAAEAEKLNELLNGAEEIEIYKDFSSKNPKAFKLDENLVEVEDWDDLLVKAAEVLTKKYKENKFKDIVINEDISIIEKKSMQNTLRDSVIDMLNEYKINLGDFKVITGVR